MLYTVPEQYLPEVFLFCITCLSTAIFDSVQQVTKRFVDQCCIFGMKEDVDKRRRLLAEGSK